MGLIFGALKSVVKLAILPVAVAADIVTVGQLEITDKALDSTKESLNEMGRGAAGEDDFL